MSRWIVLPNGAVVWNDHLNVGILFFKSNRPSSRYLCIPKTCHIVIHLT